MEWNKMVFRNQKLEKGEEGMDTRCTPFHSTHILDIYTVPFFIIIIVI